MKKNRILDSLLICFAFVLCSSSFSNAQDQNLEELRPLSEPGVPSQSVARPAPQQPTIGEWKNGKHSPDAYKVKSSDDEETRLKKQRINMALMEINHFKQLADDGIGTQTLTTAVDCQNRLLRAQLDFHTKPDEIVLALEQAFESAKTLEAIVSDQFKEGADVNIQQVGQAAFNKLDIEIELLRAKKTLPGK